jgi:hypothetical protein
MGNCSEASSPPQRTGISAIRRSTRPTFSVVRWETTSVTVTAVAPAGRRWLGRETGHSGLGRETGHSGPGRQDRLALFLQHGATVGRSDDRAGRAVLVGELRNIHGQAELPCGGGGRAPLESHRQRTRGHHSRLAAGRVLQRLRGQAIQGFGVRLLSCLAIGGSIACPIRAVGAHQGRAHGRRAAESKLIREGHPQRVIIFPAVP